MATTVGKSKILMLHGFVQSDKIFSSKTGGLRKGLKKMGYELFYPRGPELVDKSTLNNHSSKDRKASEEDEKKRIASQFNTSADSNDDLYGWWVRKTSGPQALLDYEIRQSTFDYLHDYVIENGPFDGIIGFSQGAGLAGYLAHDFNKTLNLTKEEQPDLKFFISFSGFKLQPEMYLKQYEIDNDDVPTSLHILGEVDVVVSHDRSMELFDTWSENKRISLIHPGSHFIPNSKPFVTQVCNWVKSVTQESVKTDETTPKDAPKSSSSALDDDLMSMMESIGKL